jgi:D-alanyl-D-alanine carboxypeptidase
MAAKLLSLLALFLSLSQATLSAYVQQTHLGGLLYLVNKDYALSADFVPPDLVRPKVASELSGITMKAESAQALEQLFAAAKQEGYELVAVSGYRSYSKQRAIFARKAASVGERKASLIVALPGTSEHQLGLAMDIGRKVNTHLTPDFGGTPEGRWVAQNAHRFGFIIRYKSEWTAVTGYAYEPWHIRYVGPEHSVQLFEMNIPLESYVEQLSMATFSEYIAKDGL